MQTTVTTKTPLLHEVATVVRQYGRIWSIEQVPDEGTLFRCEIDHYQFRVFIPRYGKANPQMPVEKGTPSHLVTNLQHLNEWLEKINQNR